MECAGWRPMETAPKDGQMIIARFRGGVITFRVVWNGRQWVSDGFSLPQEFCSWRPHSRSTDVPIRVGEWP